MKELIVTKDPVVLEGFQSIMKLSKFGNFNLSGAQLIQNHGKLLLKGRM